MTNRIALTLAALIAAILLADHLWLHQGLPVLLGKQLDRFIETVSFWR